MFFESSPLAWFYEETFRWGQARLTLLCANSIELEARPLRRAASGSCPRNGAEGSDKFVIAVVEIGIDNGIDDDLLADRVGVDLPPPDADRGEVVLRVFGDLPFVAIAEGPARRCGSSVGQKLPLATRLNPPLL